MGDVVTPYSSGPSGHPGDSRATVGRYAHGIAALALAAAAATGIALCVTTPSFEVGIGTLVVLGIGQSVVFWLAGSLSRGYRIASSIALLVALTTAFVPHLLGRTPPGAGTALAVATAGSLPMWGVAIGRLAGARRDVVG